MSESGATTPLGRVSTEEALIRALRDRILDGAEAAGAPLREVDLVNRFGVSRHSVRTAMRALAHEGLLRHEPNRGMYVRALTSGDVRDIYFLRAALETAAVRQVATAPETAGPARRALEAIRDLPATADWRAIRDADLAFHSALVRSAGRPRASAIFDSVLGELRLAFRQLREELADRDQVVRQHSEILEAVETGEADRAVTLVAAHLDRAVEDICANVSSVDSV